MNQNTKDRRVRKTKRLLLEGLTELMKTKSINDITVKELADRVDINRSTFYLHYQDIYDMIKHIEDDIMNQLNEVLGPMPTSNDPIQSEEEIENIIKSIFEFLYENRAVCRVLLGPNGDIKFLNKVLDNVSERINFFLRSYMTTGYTNFDLALINKFFVTGCIGLVKYWLESDDETFEKTDIPHMTSLFMDLLKNGLRVKM